MMSNNKSIIHGADEYSNKSSKFVRKCSHTNSHKLGCRSFTGIILIYLNKFLSIFIIKYR